MKQNRIKRRAMCLFLLCLFLALTLSACVPPASNGDLTTTEKPTDSPVEQTTTTAPKPAPEPEPEPSEPYDENGFSNQPDDGETKRY